eukprot:CAMPEP_0174706784 /NCGR_PEP_ID=MMETSP1094-20130205/9499_1 /TAXON_ID=156173 /ORGANISM="Chrysochromulina brevifilum, Strain UTEX LB 985" /LENGTH=33 /DNA_ID= /DNA_START= /DNA_END= /DNA_ORIENTATION=
MAATCPSNDRKNGKMQCTEADIMLTYAPLRALS